MFSQHSALSSFVKLWSSFKLKQLLLGIRAIIFSTKFDQNLNCRQTCLGFQLNLGLTMICLKLTNLQFPESYNKPVKYCIHSCTMESIALKHGLEANIELSFASCYVSLLTTPSCYKNYFPHCTCCSTLSNIYSY